MTSPGRSRLWVRMFTSLGRALLRTYPREVLDVVGPEMLEALEQRLMERRDRSGVLAAVGLGVVELVDLALAGFEARREVARGVRLGAPGYGGVDVLGSLRVLAQDARDAYRGLLRTPVTTAMVIGLIGIGVGASSSIFGVVDDVLLEPLPFEESDRLVHIWADRPWLGESRGLLADVQVQDLERSTEAFEAVSALWMVSGRVLGANQPLHTDVARVSADFFDMLGVEPFMGRTFQEGEDQPGAEWVAVLTYEAWRRDFGGDPGVLGRTITVGWPEMEIVGVLPRDFRFVIPDELGAHGVPDVWIPWWHTGNTEARIGGGSLAAIARLAPGVSLVQASEELADLAAREDATHYGGKGFAYSVDGLQAEWVADARPGLIMLSAAVVVLLLIAVANASTLLLTRTQVRTAELGLRRVLGASAGRLSRVLGIEAILVAAAGGGMGYVLSHGGARALRALAPPELPLLADSGPDGHVLLFALGVSALAALVAVIAPLSRIGRIDPGHTLRQSAGPTRSESRRTRRVRAVLVTSQVAFSVVLLVSAGLLVRTFQAVRGADLGFDEADRVTFSVYLMDEYDSHPERVAFYDQLRARLAAVPGVQAVSGTSALPLSGGAPQVPVSTFRREADVDPRGFFLTEGFSVLGAQELEGTSGDGWALADLTAAHPGYFEAIGARVLNGRSLDDRDRITSEATVVIDDVLAEHLWSGTDAVGQKLWVAGAWRDVVGVISHAWLGDLRAEPRPQAYLPTSQVQSGRVSMIVQADRPLDALVADIRAEVAAIDPLVPIADVRTVQRMLSDAQARDRFGMTVMTAFAAIAMVLVALGLYGTLSYAVGERLREIAVRRVVGADPLGVAGIVAGVGMRIAGVGLLLGLTAAVAAAQLITPLLYGVGPMDGLTYVATAVLVLMVALGACWGPSRRAMNADPTAVLRIG